MLSADAWRRTPCLRQSCTGRYSYQRRLPRSYSSSRGMRGELRNPLTVWNDVRIRSRAAAKLSSGFEPGFTSTLGQIVTSTSVPGARARQPRKCVPGPVPSRMLRRCPLCVPDAMRLPAIILHNAIPYTRDATRSGTAATPRQPFPRAPTPDNRPTQHSLNMLSSKKDGCAFRDRRREFGAGCAPTAPGVAGADASVSRETAEKVSYDTWSNPLKDLARCCQNSVSFTC